MANPQLENGFISVPNNVAEMFAKWNLSPYEWRVLFVILRRQGETTSLSQFRTLTLIPSNIVRAINSLVARNIVIKSSNGSKNSYYLQTDYTKWTSLSEFRTNIQDGCVRCGSENNLETHHIIYRSNGGDNDNSNLVCLCKGCHDFRHALEQIQHQILNETQSNRLEVLFQRKYILEKENSAELIRQRGYTPYWVTYNKSLPRIIQPRLMGS